MPSESFQRKASEAFTKGKLKVPTSRVQGIRRQLNELSRLSRSLFSLDPAIIGRRVGLMVSTLASGSSGSGSRPGREHCVVFLEKTLAVPLFTPVYTCWG